MRVTGYQREAAIRVLRKVAEMFAWSPGLARVVWWRGPQGHLGG